MNKKERIEYLKIMTKRKLLLRDMQMHIKEIVLDDFVSQDETKELQVKVFKKMDKMDYTKSSIIMPLDINYVDLYIENIHSFSSYADEKIVFFHLQSMSIGAVEILVKDVLNNIKYIVLQSEIYGNGCCIFLVNRDLKFGLCLWRSEYSIQLYKWDDLRR